jgi:hypothetical protein
MHTNEYIHMEIAQLRHQERLRKADQMRMLERRDSIRASIPTPVWLMLLIASIIVDRWIV